MRQFVQSWIPQEKWLENISSAVLTSENSVEGPKINYQQKDQWTFFAMLVINDSTLIGIF